MPLQCHDKVIDGRVHSRPLLQCEVCLKEIVDVDQGHVFWTPFAGTQPAFSHEWCAYAFDADNLYHRELKTFLAQLARVLRPEKGWNDSA